MYINILSLYIKQHQGNIWIINVLSTKISNTNNEQKIALYVLPIFNRYKLYKHNKKILFLKSSLLNLKMTYFITDIQKADI